MSKEWKNGRIGDLISSFESGVSVNGEDREPSDNEYAVLKVSSVTYGHFNPKASKPISGKELDRAKCTPRAGQIIISRASGTSAHVGASTYVYENYPMRFLSDKLWQTVPNPNVETNMKWLSYCLASPKIRSQILGFATGTNIKNITKKEFLWIPIQIPPIQEQNKIAEMLDLWDNAIEKTEALIAAKEKQFEWLTQSIIRKRCSHWKHYLAKELFGSVSSKGHPDEELLSVTQDRGVIPRTMLKGRVMSPAGSTAGYKLVEKGNFVISLRSFQGGLEYSDYQGIVSPAYTVLSSKKEIHSGFYRHFFKSYIFIEKYLSVAVIGIRDGKQISSTDFDTVKIPYPDMDEQIKIASQLDTARQEIDLLKELLEKYRSQKRGLMQKLLTGEWQVGSTQSVSEGTLQELSKERTA